MRTSGTDPHNHKYNELPSTSESKVIFIQTDHDDTTTDSESKCDSHSSADHRSKSTRTQHIKYWTVSIASKHNDFTRLKANVTTMGFGVCDATDSSSMNEIDTDQILNSSHYGYGSCVTYCDDQQYQSYHTKLKSVDDILVAFNTKTNKLALWQNGRRFNRMFQLYPSKIYAFGIKLYGDDYYIKILQNTGN